MVWSIIPITTIPLLIMYNGFYELVKIWIMADYADQVNNKSQNINIEDLLYDSNYQYSISTNLKSMVIKHVEVIRYSSCFNYSCLFIYLNNLQ